METFDIITLLIGITAFWMALGTYLFQRRADRDKLFRQYLFNRSFWNYMAVTLKWPLHLWVTRHYCALYIIYQILKDIEGLQAQHNKTEIEA